MKLSESDKEIVIDWIKSKCGVIRCTCCGLGNWTLIDSATLPIGIDVRTTRYFYAQGVPQVSLACTNCGHLLFFSPHIMGIKPIDPEEKETGIEDDTNLTKEDEE